ncbi:MAG: SGNH/GDSL hydrolase family protein [Cyanobacteria bacterium P01_H01_bin.15]
MKWFFYVLLSAGIIAAFFEVGLRLLGFGNPPLYIADQEIGYLLAPNQKVMRLGNRIEINEYSQRTRAIAKSPAADVKRILLVGDSVANGNWWTDQRQTISSLLAQALDAAFPEQYVEVLNASANSWAPRNELAYIKRFGIFEASLVVLLLNTDDLFAGPPNPTMVGRDRNYPNRKPPFAIAEIWSIFRPQKDPASRPTLIPKEKDPLKENLLAIAEFKQQVEAANSQFLLALSPLRREVESPGPRDYEIKARERLADFIDEQQISWIDFLEPYRQYGEPAKLYRDHIHLSPTGNQLVTDRLAESIRAQLTQKPIESAPTDNSTL